MEFVLSVHHTGTNSLVKELRDRGNTVETVHVNAPATLIRDLIDKSGGTYHVPMRDPLLSLISLHRRDTYREPSEILTSCVLDWKLLEFWTDLFPNYSVHIVENMKYHENQFKGKASTHDDYELVPDIDLAMKALMHDRRKWGYAYSTS